MKEKIERLLFDLKVQQGEDFLKVEIRDYVDKILS